MTLILGAVTRHHVFHASDRLITIPGRVKNTSEAWDIASNKTIIVVGADCWLVLGYTGLAYLDGKPTDQFIAEAIVGKDLSGGGITGWHQPPELMHYRAITDRVSAAVLGAYNRLRSTSRRHKTIISGVGLQQANPRLRHVSFETVHIESQVTRREFGNRNQGSDTVLTYAAGSVNHPLQEQHMKRLVPEGNESPHALRTILMDLVQETGKQSDVVGEDVLAVTMRPTEQDIRVDFRQADPKTQIPFPRDSGTDSKWADTPRVYTPYALLPGLVLAPSVATVDGWKVGTGSQQINYELHGDGLQAQPGRSYFGSHERRAQPR